MDKQLLKETLGWGFALWLFGYILGILLFAFVPPDVLGWIISPFGIAATLLVLFRKIKSEALGRYLVIGVVWMVLAIVLDYVFIVVAFKPEDGYYKLDIYLYYFLAFTLPLLVGWLRNRSSDTFQVESEEKEE